MKRILHKACLLSAVVLLLLMAVPITALADGGAEELTQTVDGYQVTLVLEQPIAVGENQFHLKITDPHGQPVTDAQVEVGIIQVEEDHEEEEIETAPQEDSHGAESTPEKTSPAPQTSMGGMGDMTEQPVTATPQSDTHGMETTPETEAEPVDEHDEMTVFTSGHEAGEYEGEIMVAVSGEWAIRVHVTVDGHLIEYIFPLHVASPQAGKNVLLGFLTVNAVILGAAFTMKFKSVAA